ncbi:MAG: hypothetical protein ACODAG_08960 [Myxococcota bacterium]
MDDWTQAAGGTMATLALALAGTLTGGGCGTNDCPLAHKRITVTVIEPYDEATRFEYNRFFIPGPRMFPSCGDLYPPDPAFTLLSGENLDPSDWNCFVSALVEESSAPVAWEPLERLVPTSEQEWVDESILAFGETSVLARGKLEWNDCEGMYSLLLWPVAPGEDFLRNPQPGEPPAWLVVRLFEPTADCPALALPDDERACADTYAARIEELVSR